MDKVETLKREMSGLVESLKNNANSLKIGKFQEMRMKIKDGILTVAKEENDLGKNQIFKGKSHLVI
ncbi:unnamed protein product [Meloidogyne enterolobii]|uniref:Uncharacterized protein n=1 Tax=Meloidogyne enterolobii TaxID=390850 RepID=A0ACB1ABM2_MELEN